jgi:hypothetical protein
MVSLMTPTLTLRLWSAVSQSERVLAATRDLRDLRDSANWATSQLYAKRVLLALKWY